MLKTMEEKGLIFKSPDRIDKRSVRIFLTAEGKRNKERSINTIMEFNEQVREVVSQQELDVFFGVFGKIQQVIDQVQAEKGAGIDKPIFEL